MHAHFSMDDPELADLLEHPYDDDQPKRVLERLCTRDSAGRRTLRPGSVDSDYVARHQLEPGPRRRVQTETTVREILITVFAVNGDDQLPAPPLPCVLVPSPTLSGPPATVRVLQRFNDLAEREIKRATATNSGLQARPAVRLLRRRLDPTSPRTALTLMAPIAAGASPRLGGS